MSASKYHWINYDDDKFEEYFLRDVAAKKGTALHLFATMAIGLKHKFPNNSQTINRYVNDAIGFNMATEQILYYSENAFGTADAISFRKERGRDSHVLRIHDLKTGVSPASMSQLEVYTALFCLEYRYKPIDIDIELRIYQSDEVHIHEPEPEKIFNIMDKIIHFDNMIEEKLKLR